MRLNRRGVTLLEMLVVLIILGIIIPLMGNLFVGMNRYIVKANKTITTLTQVIAEAKAIQTSCSGIVVRRRGNSDNYEQVPGNCLIKP